LERQFSPFFYRISKKMKKNEKSGLFEKNHYLWSLIKIN